MKTRRKREVASLDVMRLVAALVVMFYHFFFFSWAESSDSAGIGQVVGTQVIFEGAAHWAGFGWVAVELFFVISGFVILMSAQNKSAAEFLIGRITRIAPALWFFTLMSAAILSAVNALPYPELIERTVRSLVLFPIGPWVDGAVWTLVVEAVFYAGVFFLILTRLIHRMALVTITITIMNLALWTIVLMAEGGILGQAGKTVIALASSYQLRVTLISSNCYFLVGAALFGLFTKRDEMVNLFVLAGNFACSLLSTYYAARTSFAVTEFGASPFLPPLIWGIATAILGIAALMRLGSHERFGRIAVVCGLLTYPLYLVNQISGGYLLGILYRAGMNPTVAVLLAGIACTVFAAFFALMLERPMQQSLNGLLTRYTPERWIGRTKPASY